MTDKEYEASRNKLIPVAEQYANETEGITHHEKDVTRAEWAKNWNLAFLRKMDELAKEQGLTN